MVVGGDNQPPITNYMKTFTSDNFDVYTIVTDKFHEMKWAGDIEDYVEISDLYVDIDGDIYAVQHYHDERSEYSGNIVIDSEPDMRTAVLVIKHVDIMKQLYPEVFYNVNVWN